MRMIILSSLALGGLVSGCTSPAYRYELAQCRAEWSSRIPAEYRERLVVKYHTERRPTGRSVCVKRRNVLICEDEMTNVRVPYETVETFDVRAQERSNQVSACVDRACARRPDRCEG